MKVVVFVLLTLIYVLSAYFNIGLLYYPISGMLFLFAIMGTVALFTVSSVEFAKGAQERNLGWSMYPNCFINTGVLVYLGWYVAALIYGTMILMGLAKRLTGLYKLRAANN